MSVLFLCSGSDLSEPLLHPANQITAQAAGYGSLYLYKINMDIPFRKLYDTVICDVPFRHLFVP